MKRIWILLAVLACALAALAAAGAEEEGLTLLVYLCGSNLETQDAAASRDLDEMQAVLPADGSLEVLLLAGGAEAWHNGFPADEAGLYRLTQEGPEKLASAGARSMGDPETLRWFLEAADGLAGSPRRALILWDHGGGPLLGVCFDERYQRNGTPDSLSLPELAQALADSFCAGRKLEWIGFDACLMATAETAAAVAPYAEYMVASQEPEPADGWDYAFLAGLAEMEPEEAVSAVVASYRAAYRDGLDSVSLSAVDLQAVAELLPELDELFGAMDVTPEDYAACARVRDECRHVALSAPFEYDLIDLADYLDLSEAADSGALADRVRSAVVSRWSTTRYLYGLSVYFPFGNRGSYVSPWSGQYRELGFSRGYQAFLERYTGIWLGESLADWGSPEVLERQADESTTVLSARLTPEQAEQLAEARLTVYAEVTGGTVSGVYYPVFSGGDVRLSQDNVLTAAYRGECLVMADEAGTPLTGSIAYTMPEEDTLCIRAVVMRGHMTEPDFASEAVYLIYAKDEEGGWQLARALRLGDAEELAGRSEIDLAQWDEIHMISRLRKPVRDENGRLAAFGEWEETERNQINILGRPYLTGMRPCFLQVQDSNIRYACLELRDLQNRVFCTELTAVPNPNRQMIGGEGVVLADNEHFSLLLRGTEVISGVYPAVRQTFTALNRTGRRIEVRPTDLFLDDLYVNAEHLPWLSLDPGQEMDFEIKIDPEDLRELWVSRVSLIRVKLTGSADEEELFSREASVPMELDLRALAAPAEERVLGRASLLDGSVDAELIELGPWEDGPYRWQRAVFRFTSRRDQPVRVRARTVRCGDAEEAAVFTSNGEAMMNECILPAGARTCLAVLMREDLFDALPERLELVMQATVPVGGIVPWRGELTVTFELGPADAGSP